MRLDWRPMQSTDLDRVAEIAVVGFPDHFEGRDMFANRLALYPAGCFALADAGAAPVGYAVSYPWVRGSAPRLNTLVDALPTPADLFYLHDMALMPETRGLGWARRGLDRIMAQARAGGWTDLALIAVNERAPLWARLGFTVVEAPAIRTMLASYGADARYMIRPL